MIKTYNGISIYGEFDKNFSNCNKSKLANGYFNKTTLKGFTDKEKWDGFYLLNQERVIQDNKQLSKNWEDSLDKKLGLYKPKRYQGKREFKSGGELSYNAFKSNKIKEELNYYKDGKLLEVKSNKNYEKFDKIRSTGTPISYEEAAWSMFKEITGINEYYYSKYTNKEYLRLLDERLFKLPSFKWIVCNTTKATNYERKVHRTLYKMVTLFLHDLYFFTYKREIFRHYRSMRVRCKNKLKEYKINKKIIFKIRVKYVKKSNAPFKKKEFRELDDICENFQSMVPFPEKVDESKYNSVIELPYFTTNYFRTTQIWHELTTTSLNWTNNSIRNIKKDPYPVNLPDDAWSKEKGYHYQEKVCTKDHRGGECELSVFQKLKLPEPKYQFYHDKIRNSNIEDGNTGKEQVKIDITSE